MSNIVFEYHCLPIYQRPDFLRNKMAELLKELNIYFELKYRINDGVFIDCYLPTKGIAFTFSKRNPGAKLNWAENNDVYLMELEPNQVLKLDKEKLKLLLEETGKRL